MTSRRPAARRPKPGPAADARSLPDAELDRLMRSRSLMRPLPVPPPLHVMAKRRRDLAGIEPLSGRSSR